MYNDIVSIIITTQNRQELLKRALQSAMNQTYKNLEIIVVDDCSNDNTAKVVSDFQQTDKRILYIKNDTVLGSNMSRNKGVKAASGKFIAGLDDDDEFMSQRIEMLVENYDANYAFITTNNELVFDNTSWCTNMPLEVSLEQMLSENVVMNQGLIEKKRIEAVGCYNERLTACQDYDLWMRLIIAYGSVKTLSTVTQKVYMEESRTRISTCSHKKFSGYFTFYKKYKHLMTKSDRKTHFHRIYDIRNKPMSPLVSLILCKPSEVRQRFDGYVFSKALEQRGAVGYQFLIDTLLKIENLHVKNRGIILYGYGTVGRFLQKVMGDDVVGVIDQVLMQKGTKKIDGIVVISMNEIKKFQHCPIIITPHNHRDTIMKNLKNAGVENPLISLYDDSED